MAVPFFLHLEREPLHVDENHCIWFSKIFKTIFFDRDITKAITQSNFVPNLAPILIGFSLRYTCSKSEIEQISKEPWWQGGTPKITPPPQNILYSARFMMAIFASLSCLLIYFITRISFSIRAGVFASLLLAYNPLMLHYGRRAMTEAPSLFFSLAAILSMLLFYQAFFKEKFKGFFPITLSIGVYIGLACAAKFSGILTAVVFAILSLLLIVSESIKSKTEARNMRIKIILLSPIVSFTIAFFVFVSFHPALYSSPIRNTIQMTKAAHSMSLYSQSQCPNAALKTSRQKFNCLFQRVFFPGNFVILGNIIKKPLDMWFFCFGLFLLLCNEIRVFLRIRNFSPAIVPILWVFVTFAGIGLWIPLDWDRYYITVISSIAIVLGYAFDRLLRGFYYVFSIVVKQREKP